MERDTKPGRKTKGWQRENIVIGSRREMEELKKDTGSMTE